MHVLLTLLIMSWSFLPHIGNQPGNFHVDQDIAKAYFSGYSFNLSWLEGESYYGYHYSAEYHFCPNGQYWMAGNSWKRTVLDNVQRRNWNDSGKWEIVTHQGQFYMQLTNQVGENQYTQFTITPNNEIKIVFNGEVSKAGKANCN